MRQHLGPKKIAKYKRITGLPVIGGLVRGNTEHRVDLILEDHSMVHLWPDGTMEPSSIRGRLEEQDK